MLLQFESHMVIFYRSHFTLRMNAHVGLRDAEQRVRTCISPEPGERGTERRTANYSATPAITIYSPRHVNSFLGPGYSSAIAGHAASRNTFLERLFIAPDFSDDAEFGESERTPGSFQSASIQISSLPRVRGARSEPCFSSRDSLVAPVPTCSGSLIKTSIWYEFKWRKTTARISRYTYARKEKSSFSSSLILIK